MDLLFYVILPLIAIAYAAVGHGGASGYLALMGLFAFDHEVLRPTALVLNLFVAGISFIQFYRAGYFKFKLFIWFALSSIPLAMVGGSLSIDGGIYKIILGAFLVLAVLKMVGIFNFKSAQEFDQTSRPSTTVIALIIGGAIGFMSGLIGIGGGIILSPVILLLRWGTAKEAAAVSALFIWVNSLAGLIGHQLTDRLTVHENWWIFAGLVIAGGLLGGYIGAKKMSNQALRIFLSIVLGVAAVKLIFGL